MCRSGTLPCFRLASVFLHGSALLCSSVCNASHSLIPTPFVQLIFHTLLSSVDAFAVEPRKACKCSRANHFLIVLYL
uniref:Putative secreted protein n=1 Tax=Ixodes ricinus TaxID=34613 RepID=A0A6B0U4X0_IXORI